MDINSLAKATYNKVLSQIGDTNGRIGNNKDEGKVYNRIKSFDSNKDDKITLEEFTKGLSKKLDLRHSDIDVSEGLMSDILADIVVRGSISTENASYLTDTSKEELAKFVETQTGADISENQNYRDANTNDAIKIFQELNGEKGANIDGKIGFGTAAKMISTNRKMVPQDKDLISDPWQYRITLDFSNIKSVEDAIKILDELRADPNYGIEDPIRELPKNLQEKIFKAIENDDVTTLKKIPVQKYIHRAHASGGLSYENSFYVRVKSGQNLTSILKEKGYNYHSNTQYFSVQDIRGNILKADQIKAGQYIRVQIDTAYKEPMD